MSIRLRLDGHTFSLAALKTEGVKQIVLLSHKSVMVPSSELASKGAESVLEAAGVVMESTEGFVAIEDGDRSVIVVAPKERIEQTEAARAEATYSSPLLQPAMGESNHLVVLHAQGLTYINIYAEGELTFAEVFLSPTPTDMLYWISKIDEAMCLDLFTIYVAGGDVAIKKMVSRHFNNVELCE